MDVDFTPDDAMFVSGSCDNTVKLWSVGTHEYDGHCLATGSGHTLDVNAVSVSADGRYVAFRSNATTLVPGPTTTNLKVFVTRGMAATSAGTHEILVSPSRAVENVDFGSHAHPGDANLDGRTDVRDFSRWNENKFTRGTDWTTGDFNFDGLTDVRDFNIWNAICGCIA